MSTSARRGRYSKNCRAETALTLIKLGTIGAIGIEQRPGWQDGRFWSADSSRIPTVVPAQNSQRSLDPRRPLIAYFNHRSNVQWRALPS